jgi:hypothetical protein
MDILSIKPGVRKQFLILLSGLMWIGVGILLLTYAAGWLIHYEGKGIFYYILAGFLAALIIHHFGFLRLVDKNLGRIAPLEGKPCVFSFMSWKSYLIVAIMVTLGIMLRHSSIPKQYLSILYNGIGLALILSSIRYFRYFLQF